MIVDTVLATNTSARVRGCGRGDQVTVRVDQAIVRVDQETILVDQEKILFAQETVLFDQVTTLCAPDVDVATGGDAWATLTDCCCCLWRCCRRRPWHVAAVPTARPLRRRRRCSVGADRR